ncbi:MAG: type II secretion system F family protein [SAR324 cluster bacterium]|nr:type II secretion system F family protein [SAR324 cluster bacterium]
MPVYDYQAVNDIGDKIKGSLVANEIRHLETILNERGLFLLVAHEQTVTSNFFERFRGSSQDTLVFTIHMATGFQAGLPLIEIIDDMIEESEKGHFRKVLQDIKINVEAGNNLSEALSMYPNYFPDIYRVIVKTGEESGRLEDIFQYLVTMLEWEKGVKKQIKKTVTPILGILVMLVGLFVLVLTTILPNFIDLFQSSGVALPAPTQILISTGDFLNEFWHFLLVGGFGCYIVYKLIRFTTAGRYYLDKVKLAIPVTGMVVQKLALSRFANFWKILFASGVDLAKSLEIVSEVVQNKKMEKAILDARTEIINGREMAKAFRQTKMFPGLVLRMINLGETTGNLETSLDKVTEYYDKEIPETIDNLLGVMKPLMLICAASLIVMVGLGIVLPMYGMIETIH